MTKEILVIHQGAIGDLVLSFPALLSLKHNMGVSLTLLCSTGMGKIAQELNVADAYFSLDSARFTSLFHGGMTSFAKAFISRYDTIVLVSFSGAVEHHLRKNHNGEVYRVSPRPPVDEETHVALHLVRQLEAKHLLTKSETYCSYPSRVALNSFATVKGLSHQNRLLVLHPGAGSPRKRWPVQSFIQVATMLTKRHLGEVVFVVGPAESDLTPIIEADSKGAFRVHEVDEFFRLMALLRQARCFVGNDSGVTHFAAFMGIPTVAIFGPSSPKRWSPEGRATKVLRGNRGCVPCFETIPANCKDAQCLNGVSVKMVLNAVEDLALHDGECDGRSSKG